MVSEVANFASPNALLASRRSIFSAGFLTDGSPDFRICRTATMSFANCSVPATISDNAAECRKFTVSITESNRIPFPNRNSSSKASIFTSSSMPLSNGLTCSAFHSAWSAHQVLTPADIRLCTSIMVRYVSASRCCSGVLAISNVFVFGTDPRGQEVYRRAHPVSCKIQVLIEGSNSGRIDPDLGHRVFRTRDPAPAAEF